MTIGDVIKKYRKNLGMTQEEMANRLGVTTPAVCKWENNITLPDVALLAPIARLLSITTDELLSFKDDLTPEEINQFLSQLQKDLESNDFSVAFLLAKQKIEKYPNCMNLILQTALVLSDWQTKQNDSDNKKYEDTINRWFEQCMLLGDKKIKDQAAWCLFHNYFRKKDYEKAFKFTEIFSDENPERKRMEALIYSKTGRKEEAYRTYEEILFSEYQHLQSTLNHLRMIYMEDGNHEMANKLVSISSAMAASFEMGRYHEVCVGLDVATWEKDVARTIQIMNNLWNSIDTIEDFTKSNLYKHMTFKPIGSDFAEEVKKEIFGTLRDESYDYMKGNEQWENFIKSIGYLDS